ncbi:MAG: ATP-binding protein [Xanthomonadales bacterium]|nr:ATP-binding protein [Xanthomonadales bacterium]
MTLRSADVTILLDSAPDAMVVANGDGHIVFANSQTNTLFGYSADQLIGQPVEILLPERYRNTHEQHRGRYARQPHRRPMGDGLELFGLRQNGEEFPVEISLSPVETEDGQLVISAIRDVSERAAIQKDLEHARDEAEKANRAKSAFLAAASHDLRQPLQALKLLNSVLEKTTENSRQADAISRQHEALGSMTDLLNSLLDVSKLESGAITPDIGDCEVAAIFHRLRSEFEVQAQAKGLRLEVDECDDVIRTDANLLEQIIQNLVANAIRYTRQGQVQLRTTQLNDTLRIEVVDTGIGIPGSEIETIFEEFHQLDRIPGQPREGLGLGLSIVQRLADLLKHPIGVESTPGEGTCFSVTVPRAKRPQLVSKPILVQPAPSTSRHVLIIDDDPAVSEATRMLLEVEGHEVTPASTLEQAQAGLDRDGRPDIIVTDYHLGVQQTGVDAILKLRNQLGLDVPAVLVTGDTSAAIMGEVEEVPNCQLLSKPVDTEKLLTLIQESAGDLSPMNRAS